MSAPSYDQINRWNVLLEALCNKAGFVDTASLAARFCELSNNGGQRDFDTAVRNLNNWRSGRHVPRLRSLRVLEQLLRVDDDPALAAQWHALYRNAREAEEDDDAAAMSADVASGAQQAQASTRAFFGWLDYKAFAGGVILFGLGMGTGAFLVSDWQPWGGLPKDSPLVTYTPEFKIAVGESRIIHAERGDCGKLPREWPDVSSALPASQTGTFSDGGLARRNSKFCKGETPARAIMFTANVPGVEELLIQGDFFRVTVADAGEEKAQATPP